MDSKLYFEYFLWIAGFGLCFVHIGIWNGYSILFAFLGVFCIFWGLFKSSSRWENEKKSNNAEKDDLETLNL